MADVRLTATNPEDSSVVYVACNEKGELKLEEPLVVEGPPGAPGEQGPPGEKGNDGAPGEDGKDGDPFSGNFTGDVQFLGNVEIGNTPADSFSLRVFGKTNDEINEGNAVLTVTAQGGNGMLHGIRQTFPYSAYIQSGFVQDISVAQYVLALQPLGGDVGISTSTPQAKLDVNGDVRFASNKAGFTEEGYLWCTTRRGDTVILDFTSNGMATWAPYTPPNRLTELQDKLAELKPGPPTDIDSSRLTKD